jgi:catechol 2,3-dioxygenase-like lactoylglutathione lyase family enzyme
VNDRERVGLPALRLTHARLLVRDYAAAFRFWSEIVGLEPTYGDIEGRYADFEVGSEDTSLAIFEARFQDGAMGLPERSAERGPDQVALVFRVDAVDEAVATLEARGVTFVSPATDQPDWGIRVAHFRDPEGNLVEIYEDLPAEGEA